MSERCQRCGVPLSRDDIGLHKKMINRGATSFWCIRCLADFYHCDTALLEQKREQFRAMGCTLFDPLPLDNGEKEI